MTVVDLGTIASVVLGALLAMAGGRVNRRIEVQREAQAKLFDRMDVVRGFLGEAYSNPSSPYLKEELGKLFRVSVLADRGTLRRAGQIIALSRERDRVLAEHRSGNTYGDRELDVIARQEYEDLIQEISQLVEQFDEHVGNRLRRWW